MNPPAPGSACSKRFESEAATPLPAGACALEPFVSRRAFDMLCERAVSRYTHGSVLADKQMIQDMVATSAALPKIGESVLFCEDTGGLRLSQPASVSPPAPAR